MKSGGVRLADEDRDHSSLIDRDVLTAEQVAEVLQVPARRVLQLPIPQVRLGRRTIRYLADDVMAYLKKKRFAE